MLLYTHRINDIREARGALPVNSFWLSGCGPQQPVHDGRLLVDDRLRAPALADDWAAWAEAWRALDAGPVSELLALARRGGEASITLAGERHAQRFDAMPRSAWQRLSSAFRGVAPHTVLESL
jgi:hypothetical protein